MKKYLYAALLCWFVAVLSLYFMFGCSQYQPFPEGQEKVTAPVGYYIHCKEFPDSVFCKENK